jgi:hypothetical protein
VSAEGVVPWLVVDPAGKPVEPIARPQPHQGSNDVTGGTAAIFTPVRRRASGIWG